MTKTRSPEEEAALAEFCQSIATAERESQVAAAAALEAIPRLVKACYRSDSGQAVVIVQALASIYNGDNARPVQLDEIRRLDWTLQKDLTAVIIGVGKGTCNDTEIRKAFEALGGEEAVEWFHWYTTGGIHRQALDHLIKFIKGSSRSSSAVALRGLLDSIASGGPADLSRLNFMDDEHTKAVVIVLDGLFGRDQGMLHIEDIQAALSTA